MATITKRGDTYRIKVSCGYNAAGKQVTRSMTWKPKPGMTEKQVQKELERQAVLFEEKCKSGVGNGNIRFQAFIEQWFTEYAASHLKRKTYHEYQRMTKRVYAALGHVRLDKLRPQHFRAFYNQLAQPGQNERTGEPLASKTIWNYHAFLSSVMGYAVKNELIERNPCSLAAPKQEKRPVRCLDDVEARIFLDALEDETLEYKVLFTLALFTGYRRGELLGLEWQDIDFERGVITVRRTSQYVKELGTYTDTPKTASSARSTKISAHLCDLLREYRAEQAKRRIALRDYWRSEWDEHPRLFTNQDGAPMSPTAPENRIKKILQRAGLPPVSLHSLRHTNATLLITSGINVRTVSARLGHSQTSTTMNIYAEAIQSAEAAAAESLDERLLNRA